MRSFGDVFEKNIDVNVFDHVPQNAKHRANDASNDVNRPPLIGSLFHKKLGPYWVPISKLGSP